MRFTISVNGIPQPVEAEPGTPLLWVLRDGLGLTGTKYGCGVAQCGACTVHIEREAVRACSIPIDAVGESRVVTIEGLDDPVGDTVRDAWRDLEVPQCGYCQSGQIMAATMLLRRIRVPTDEDIDAAMIGNVCRCCTYQRIRAAIHRAADVLAGNP